VADIDEEHGFKLERLGAWSERKIRIVEKYAKAYISVLKGKGLKTYYIDGFTGGGVAVRKDTGDLVITTARRILEIEPPFDGYHLIDFDPAKVAAMKAAEPQPEADEILIDVHAVSVSYMDYLMISGSYQMRPTLPYVPGTDAAGVVVACGEKVQRFRPGDRVACALSASHSMSAVRTFCMGMPASLRALARCVGLPQCRRHFSSLSPAGTGQPVG
jgi:hypothetical protein